MIQSIANLIHNSPITPSMFGSHLVSIQQVQEWWQPLRRKTPQAFFASSQMQA
ncbi:hypothetical protein RBWH47_06066 [Rhodopirellula baltica WH47]|uniref:Uncharacterized protein n=1 Tax=Rhodopirellula baltica WH47 TaxID=991778 RepID=F2AKH4_RHOBT|nr:hypothetical protein RBWH47_06066 [Rhodopirellula baltica WH47]